MDEAQSTAQAARLPLDKVLPPELLTAICNTFTFGDGASLDILRTTSRAFRASAWPAYAKWSFSSRIIPFTTRSIAALAYIATHDRVEGEVKSLRLSTWSPTGSAAHLIGDLSLALEQMKSVRSIIVYDGENFGTRIQLHPSTPEDAIRWQADGLEAIFKALRDTGRDAGLECLSMHGPVPYAALPGTQSIAYPVQCLTKSTPRFESLRVLKLELKHLSQAQIAESPCPLDPMQSALSNFLKSMPNLKSLDLKFQPLEPSRSRWALDNSDLNLAFKHIADLHIPHLAYVSFTNIRGRYGRSNEHLKKFVRRHASTLKGLELIDCSFTNLIALLEFLADEASLERFVHMQPTPKVSRTIFVDKSLLDRVAKDWRIGSAPDEADGSD